MGKSKYDSMLCIIKYHSIQETMDQHAENDERKNVSQKLSRNNDFSDK